MRPNFMTAVSRLMARAAVSGMLCIAAIANAAETNGPTAWTGVLAGNTATVNEPSALTVTVNTTSVATRGLITVGDSASPITPVSQPLNSRGATAAMFGVQDTADADSLLDSPSPLAVATTQAVNFVTQVLASCPIASPSGSACTNMGTITVTFSRPVRNPILHLSGIGGSNDAGGVFGSDIARLNVRLILASSLPAGASLGVRSAGATNLVSAGNTIETANVDASVSCATTDDSAPGTAAALAGCGSVQVNGTVTSLTFNVEMKYRVVACTGFLCTPSSISVTGSADAFNLTVSLPQDFSDAPASYGVPRHVIGDLRIGSAIDADRTNTENPTTSSFAATSPNDAIGDDSEASGADDVEPGDDEDGVSFGTLTVGMAGSGYSTTVALSGASQPGEVCGWVDFNRSGAFDVGERVCASFAAGATSAVLTWTVPAGITAGATYARVRAAYGAAGGGASSPTGAVSSGEVEDYRIMIVNPQIRVAKITQGSAGGPFAFSTTNTVSQPAALTTTAANVAQTGSPVSIASLSSDVVVTETALPAGWTLTAINCTQAGGGAVAGTVYDLTTRQATIPSGSLSGTSDITCTYTNTQQGSITIVKDAVPNDAQDFAFTTTGTGLSDFSLDDDADAALLNTRTFNGLAPGSYTVTEGAVAGWALTNLICADPDSGSTVNVGTRVATIDLDAGENITCTYTNTKAATLQLRKSWAGAIVNNAVNIPATSGFANNATSLASVADTATEIDSGTPINVFPGEVGTLPAETFTAGNAANYTATLACTGGGTLSGTNAQASNTLTINAADAGATIVCTYANTRKTANITLQKTWVNATLGDAVNVTATGLTTLASMANTANETDAGAVQTVRAGDVITLGETFTTGSAANYTSVLTCTGTTGLTGNTLTVGAADTAIVCTETNTRKSTTLQLAKAWGANSLAGNVASIGATTGLTNNTATLTSTAPTNSSGIAVTVFAGETATLPAETMSPGTLANYTTVLSCTGAVPSGNNGQASNTVAVGTAAGPIVCTYTNTRKTANITLQKTWVNATLGDAVNVTATGLTTLASTANTANETDAGAVQTVRAGDVITLGETFTTGSVANYTATLACTGTSGLLGSTLTVGSADTNIVCTETNTRRSTTLQLAKAWGANSIAGNVASIGPTTGLTNNTATLSSTAPTNSTGIAVTVFAGETATLPAETMSIGTLINYTTSLSCTGATPSGANGQTSNTVPVGTAAGPIVCTYTNTRKTANITLQKTWVNATLGDAVNVTATGLTTLASTANTANETDAGAVQTVRAGDVLTLGEAFTTGSAGNYASTLACTGTSGLSGNTLTVGSADTTIVCTQTNTRRTADLAITKVSTPNGPFTPGQTISYAVTATNNGPFAANDATVYDPVVAGLNCTAITSCTSAGGAVCPGSPTMSGLQTPPGLAIPTFPSGGSVTFTLSCQVTATGQ